MTIETSLANIVISNNTIDQGRFSDGATPVTYNYDYSAWVFGSANITSNSFLSSVASTDILNIDSCSCIITNNKFVRGATSINTYIRVYGAEDPIIKNNIFDSTTVDGASTILVSGLTGYTVAQWMPGSQVKYMISSADGPLISNVIFWKPIPQSASAQSIEIVGGSFYPQAASTHATNAWGFWIPIDRFLINGATLTSATLHYTPSNSGANPTVFPQIGFLRALHTSYFPTHESLHSSNFIIDSGGTYDTSVTRQLVYTPNQNNVIDTSTYSYACLIYDEHGTNASAGNAFHGVNFVFTVNKFLNNSFGQ